MKRKRQSSATHTPPHPPLGLTICLCLCCESMTNPSCPVLLGCAIMTPAKRNDLQGRLFSPALWTDFSFAVMWRLLRAEPCSCPSGAFSVAQHDSVRGFVSRSVVSLCLLLFAPPLSADRARLRRYQGGGRDEDSLQTAAAHVVVASEETQQRWLNISSSLTLCVPLFSPLPRVRL